MYKIQNCNSILQMNLFLNAICNANQVLKLNQHNMELFSHYISSALSAQCSSLGVKKKLPEN